MFLVAADLVIASGEQDNKHAYENGPNEEQKQGHLQLIHKFLALLGSLGI